MDRFKHQLEIFDRTKDLPAYCLAWKMRVGKTLPMIDTAVYLYEQGSIDGVLLIAPNGVHFNWSRKAIPEVVTELENDFEEEVDRFPDLGAAVGDRPKHLISEFSSSKSHTKTWQKEFEQALSFKGLLWFCFNVDAVYQKKGVNKFIEKFMAVRRFLLVVDESHKCKDPSKNRTKGVLDISADKHCLYRRILTGTPVSQGPFDLWSQYAILDMNIIKERYPAFKNRYGIFKTGYAAGGRPFKQLDTEKGSYKNLDQLTAILAPYTSRLTYAEVAKNISDKVHHEPIMEKRFFELSDTQRKVYDQLREELLVQLDSGEIVTAQMAMTCLIRLQQISRGFVGGLEGEDTSVIKDLGDPYPALDALDDIVEQAEGKVIVWCHFKSDVDLVMKRHPEFVRYDGQTKTEDRFLALEAMRNDPKCKGLVGTPACGGVGIDIASADTMIFYSHGYSYPEREQAIARMLGPNQKSENTLVVDLVGADTTDENCLAILEKKDSLAQILTGDRERLKLFLKGGV